MFGETDWMLEIDHGYSKKIIENNMLNNENLSKMPSRYYLIPNAGHKIHRENP